MRRRILAAAVTAAALALLTGCFPTGDNGPSPDDPNTLRVLAGSEVKDMVPILQDAAAATGVNVLFTYTGTLAGTELVASGGAEGTYDATWFPNNRYLALLPGADKQIKTATKIMTSPVVFGLRSSIAHQLGWDTVSPTWGEIAQAAAAGKFSYGMTNPSASNSGFSALVAVATALSGTGSALTTADIDAVTPAMTDFFSAQKLTAGSSGWLADRFVEDPTLVDGIINYESVLRGLQDQGEDLTIVIPSDGVVTSDYPLTLLSSADSNRAAAYQKLTAWLTTPEVQKRIALEVHRRPGIPGIDTGDEFPSDVLFETPFPNTLEVANTLIATYLDTARAPSQAIFVLDTSGSMEGDRITELKTAVADLTGSDTSTQGSFTQFRGGERITLLPFSTTPGTPVIVDVPKSDTDAALGQIRDEANSLVADGDTAIYDSLHAAYRLAITQKQQRPDTFVSIVLMTDGENTVGWEPSDFEQYYNSLGAEAEGIPVFVVLFGNGDVDALTHVADITGGQVFDALNGDLAKAFQEIRGYQ
ncbi:MAG: VWA domain-containing protein [Pseudolysinimonas sp.]|uniref:VWA domain-containing protein n=1 Tax=Pseudolysinimonas sp. TaxID=2680009 RepID=UPI0032679659